MPERVSTVEIPFPAVPNPLHLVLALGACRVDVVPGGDAWVSGTHEDPSGALPFTVKQEGGTVRLSVAYKAAQSFGLLREGLPRFALRLGGARPFALSVEGGASDVSLDLGGVPLVRVVVRQGAGRFRCRWSAPNPAEMDRLDVEAGAMALSLHGLGHANFSELRLDGGAAQYDLRFDGALRRDATARLNAGMTQVKLAVPSATAARIAADATLGAVHVGDGFMTREGAFWTEAAVRGATPALTVRVTLSLGALDLAAL
jgi:hypothetical protein